MVDYFGVHPFSGNRFPPTSLLGVKVPSSFCSSSEDVLLLEVDGEDAEDPCKRSNRNEELLAPTHKQSDHMQCYMHPLAGVPATKLQ